MAMLIDPDNGVTFPNWTTATRPSSPIAGETGFNTTTSKIEFYNGTTWVAI